MASHRDLLAWQVAMDLTRTCYHLTDSFPKREWFGIADQIRRAAVSVPSNIAEGCGRATRPDLKRFLSIARGSLKELETLLEIARDLGFGKRAEIDAALALADRESRLLWKLYRSLK